MYPALINDVYNLKSVHRPVFPTPHSAAVPADVAPITVACPVAGSSTNKGPPLSPAHPVACVFTLRTHNNLLEIADASVHGWVMTTASCNTAGDPVSVGLVFPKPMIFNGVLATNDASAKRAGR